MSRWQLIVCGTLLLAGSITCWFFPLFHVRKMNSGESIQLANNTGTQEPRKLEGYATGTEVTELWSALDADSSKAQSQYGRQPGLGGAWYYCVQGRGIVESVEKNRVVLAIDKNPRHVCLEMGVVVDNTVRESIGVKASDFANSQDFNAVSTELNRQVEQEVIAPNRDRLKPGAIVEFVGCAKIRGKPDFDPLCLIPIRLQISESKLGVGTGKQQAQPAEKSP